MITFLRYLFLENFFLKLFSLILAVVVWLIVAFASKKEVVTTPRVFTDVAIKVLSATEDVRAFKVNPNTAEVTVQGSTATLQNLHSRDIQALVDLTGVATARGLRKRVEVTVPAGITLVRVVPEDVLVLFPPTEH
jgi:hypothetical protein